MPRRTAARSPTRCSQARTAGKGGRSDWILSSVSNAAKVQAKLAMSAIE